MGVSIFSVQRTGQLYGSKNKATSVCHPRGWGRGWQGELRTRREAQECGKAGLPRSPPPCLQGVRKESFFLWEDRVCLGLAEATSCTQLLLAVACHFLLMDAPGAEGPELDQHPLLYPLTNICSEPTVCQGSLALKGKQPRHSPNVKSQLGGPQDWNSSWPGQWRLEADPPWEKQQASSITETGPSTPCPSPHTAAGGGEDGP